MRLCVCVYSCLCVWLCTCLRVDKIQPLFFVRFRYSIVNFTIKCRRKLPSGCGICIPLLFNHIQLFFLFVISTVFVCFNLGLNFLLNFVFVFLGNLNVAQKYLWKEHKVGSNQLDKMYKENKIQLNNCVCLYLFFIQNGKTILQYVQKIKGWNREPITGLMKRKRKSDWKVEAEVEMVHTRTFQFCYTGVVIVVNICFKSSGTLVWIIQISRIVDQTVLLFKVSVKMQTLA